MKRKSNQSAVSYAPGAAHFIAQLMEARREIDTLRELTRGHEAAVRDLQTGRHADSCHIAKLTEELHKSELELARMRTELATVRDAARKVVAGMFLLFQ